MEEKNKNKKKKIIRIVSLLGLFLFVFGVSYALFTVVLNGTKKNRITTGDLGLILTDTSGNTEEEGYGVNLENTLPMTQEEGLQTEPYKFVVKNIGNIPVSYKLKLNDIEGVENTLKDEYIRYNLIEKDYLKEYREGAFPQGYYSTEKHLLYNLETGDGGETYLDASPKLSESPNRILEETTILPGESIEYNLNLWLDEKATTEQAANKTFEGKIEVDGTQAVSHMTGKAGDNIDYTLYNDGTLVYSGIGAMKGMEIAEAGYEISNNGGALFDIMYKHLKNNGLDTKEVDMYNIGTYNAMILYSYFDGMGDFGELYDSLADHSMFDLMFNTVPDKETLKRVIDTTPKATRIIIDEGITATTGFTAIEHAGMTSLPTTLTAIESSSFFGNVYLNIPSSVTNVKADGFGATWTINIDNTKEFVDTNFEYDKNGYSSWEEYAKSINIQNINYSK